MKVNAAFRENLRIAVDSVRSNKVRAALTILIIAFGIMALVGILTAIDAIRSSLDSNFTSLGANTFKIQSHKMNVRMGGRHEHVDYKDISYSEATRFSEEFPIPSTISVTSWLTRTATLKNGSEKTNPNIPIMGIDENYFAVSGYNLDKGRNFTHSEIQRGDNSIIIGSDIVDKLFKDVKEVVGKPIVMGGHRFRVVGILKSKGSSFGGNGDQLCFIPLNKARQINIGNQMSFTINIMPSSGALLDVSISEAEGLFRIIRKQKLAKPNNFEIVKSDMLVNMLMENIKFVTIAATIIGIITLLGASIGLMNILLVSVAEKTREIGTRKALGAENKTISQQFLLEAVFICQLGGVLGIILGILAGNIIAIFTEGPFIVPWLWIIGGLLLCFVVGISAGIIPAIKASRLNPIDALRYE